MLDRFNLDRLNEIPGYRGYRAKEDRRDADKRVREHVATVYSGLADRVQAVASALAAQRRLNEIGPVDQFAQQLRHFINRVQTATYGYGGLFSDRNVDEAALDQLRQFDESLLEGVDELNKPISDLEAALANNGDLAAPAQAGTAVVRQLQARLDLRNEVIETGKPAAQQKVLQVLQPVGSESPPAAYDLKRGDALSILGDDYLVDATIAIDAGPQSFRLFRFQGAPERWLFVPQQHDATLGLLSPVPAPPATSPSVTIDGGTYSVAASGSGTGEINGVSGNVSDQSVRFTRLQAPSGQAGLAVLLDWGKERQLLAGKPVNPDDIEIYARRS